MQSIISYQNNAFFIHLERMVSSAYVHLYKDLQLEKHVHVEYQNFIKIEYPQAKGKFQIRISCPEEEISKTIII